MASHFKWYPAESEIIVPFNARYSFPSQANKAIKMTPRIPPKNAAEFGPGTVIRVEFPAQGYVNPGKTTLEFDVVMNYTAQNSDSCHIRFQNNIQSIFTRARLLYGSTPLEDIPYYNVVVRALTEWTGTNQQGTYDQTSINEGIGGTSLGMTGRYTFPTATSTDIVQVPVNVRQAFIQGYDLANGVAGLTGHGVVPNATVPLTAAGMANHPQFIGNNPVRRYQIQFALGLFSQEKLIPTKFMASQLAVELTLANVAECMYVQGGSTSTYAPPGLSYTVKNVNLIPEILEFDASYDESFLRGLQSGGVPIKFSTWNQYRFSTANSSSMNLQIQERSRSVKAIFALQRRDGADLNKDNGASFFNTDLSQKVMPKTSGTTGADNGSTMQEYQYRIGGRYFPSQAVQCATDVGGKISNGGCEAWIEMSKALNVLGDYRLSSSVNTNRWAANPAADCLTDLTTDPYEFTILPEFDYDYSLVQNTASGMPLVKKITTAASGAAGTLGSSIFGIAIDLETSNGLEISGLNAEEQSDISLIVRYSKPQGSVDNSMVFDVFTYIDSMIVLRENNVLELIQ